MPPRDEIWAKVYDELKKLAAARLAGEAQGHSLDATALVHEAYLRLGDAAFADRSGFFQAAAVAMQRILVDHARRKKAGKRGGGARTVVFESDSPLPTADPDLLLDLDEALTRLADEDPTSADVARYRLFAGLSIEEAAEAMGVSRPRRFASGLTRDRGWRPRWIRPAEPVRETSGRLPRRGRSAIFRGPLVAHRSSHSGSPGMRNRWTTRVVALMAAFSAANSHACTSIVVSRGASKDGSVMVTYSADAPFMPRLLRVPGGSHPEGSMIDVVGWENDQIRGKVRQASRTYTVVGLMNEHQLSLGETTTGGRRELVNRDGQLDYDGLMMLTLQRAKTAREAIQVIDDLTGEYGYGSSGETFSIADKDEAWIMELIGKGPGTKGIVWVAARVPEGMITSHANMSRITTFPLNDPENWKYSADVINFAVEKGFYKTEAGKPFSYRDAYHPNLGASQKRACAGRVWSVCRRAAPSQKFSDAFFRGEDETAEDYPLFVKPDTPLGVKDVMDLMRDHYEGTPYDMTKGVDAGPFGSPYRFRELKFSIDGKDFMWERPISTQQAGFVVVTQSRKALPDAVGGVTWFTPDDASTSCFTPLYCDIAALPAPYEKGDYKKFSWESAWWVTNLVSNLAYDRWSRVIPDIQAAQKEQESALLTMQPIIEEAAAKLAATDPTLMKSFLTNYSVSTGEGVFRRWQGLAETILTRHVDGYVKDARGRSRGVGYSSEWLRKVVEERPDQFRLKPGKAGETDH